MRTPSNLLILNLACSDWLLVCCLPLYLYNTVQRGMAIGAAGCSLYGFLGGVSGTCSIMTLAAVSLDRCLVITFPLDPSKKLTSARAAILILIIWSYSLAFSSFPLLGIPGILYTPEGFITSCSFDYLSNDRNNSIFIWSFFVAAWVVPLCTILYSYTSIIRIVSENLSQKGSMTELRKSTSSRKESKVEISKYECKPISGNVYHTRENGTPSSGYQMTTRKYCVANVEKVPSFDSEFSCSKRAHQTTSFGPDKSVEMVHRCGDALHSEGTNDERREPKSQGVSFIYRQQFVPKRPAGLEPLNSQKTGIHKRLHQTSYLQSERLKRRQISEMRLTRVAAGIVLLWFSAWTPYAVVALLGIMGYERAITPLGSLVPALTCKLAACIDPYVYALSHPRCKRELYRQFMKLTQRHRVTRDRTAHSSWRQATGHRHSASLGGDLPNMVYHDPKHLRQHQIPRSSAGRATSLSEDSPDFMHSTSSRLDDEKLEDSDSEHHNRGQESEMLESDLKPKFSRKDIASKKHVSSPKNRSKVLSEYRISSSPVLHKLLLSFDALECNNKTSVIILQSSQSYSSICCNTKELVALAKTSQRSRRVSVGDLNLEARVKTNPNFHRRLLEIFKKNSTAELRKENSVLTSSDLDLCSINELSVCPTTERSLLRPHVATTLSLGVSARSDSSLIKKKDLRPHSLRDLKLSPPRTRSDSTLHQRSLEKSWRFWPRSWPITKV